jgi:hypothetical protein
MEFPSRHFRLPNVGQVCRLRSLVFRAVLKLFPIEVQVVVIPGFCDTKANFHFSSLIRFTRSDSIPVWRRALKKITNERISWAFSIVWRSPNDQWLIMRVESEWGMLIDVLESRMWQCADHRSDNLEWFLRIEGCRRLWHWKHASVNLDSTTNDDKGCQSLVGMLEVRDLRSFPMSLEDRRMKSPRVSGSGVSAMKISPDLSIFSPFLTSLTWKEWDETPTKTSWVFTSFFARRDVNLHFRKLLDSHRRERCHPQDNPWWSDCDYDHDHNCFEHWMFLREKCERFCSKKLSNRPMTDCCWIDFSGLPGTRWWLNRVSLRILVWIWWVLMTISLSHSSMFVSSGKTRFLLSAVSLSDGLSIEWEWDFWQIEWDLISTGTRFENRQGWWLKSYSMFLNQINWKSWAIWSLWLDRLPIIFLIKCNSIRLIHFQCDLLSWR